jgi:hypothetical protein
LSLKAEAPESSAATLLKPDASNISSRDASLSMAAVMQAEGYFEPGE